MAVRGSLRDRTSMHVRHRRATGHPPPRRAPRPAAGLLRRAARRGPRAPRAAAGDDLTDERRAARVRRPGRPRPVRAAAASPSGRRVSASAAARTAAASRPGRPRPTGRSPVSMLVGPRLIGAVPHRPDGPGLDPALARDPRRRALPRVAHGQVLPAVDGPLRDGSSSGSRCSWSSSGKLLSRLNRIYGDVMGTAQTERVTLPVAPLHARRARRRPPDDGPRRRDGRQRRPRAPGLRGLVLPVRRLEPARVRVAQPLTA